MPLIDFDNSLVNSRSNAFLELMDVCKLSDSELVDLYMGICLRLKHLIELTDTPIHQAVQMALQEFETVESDRIVSPEYIQELRDDH